jgi:coenzyme F420-0:L-glutamate ligase/coenzyme F420-1:gamma-L-glutamate ligase
MGEPQANATDVRFLGPRPQVYRRNAVHLESRLFTGQASVGLTPQALRLTALEGVPEIRPGDSLDAVVSQALERNQVELANGDVVAVCQKIVSKAEDRFVALDSVIPSPRAVELAQRCDKDARFVEVVLRQSTQIVRCVKDVLIVRHRLGFVVANAGVDQSNIENAGSRVLLLPEDPDRSAARIRDALAATLGVRVGVLITDSFGRPWRMGVCGTCIGCAGLVPLADARGRLDRFGRPLRVTQIAVADAIAAAAALAMGEADEGRPIVVVSGVAQEFLADGGSATQLVRPAQADLFL